MSKRRLSGEEEAAPQVSRTPEERRRARKKERAAKKSGKTGKAGPWRRAAYVGVPALIVVAVAVILITLTNANSIPCLQLTPVPVGSSGTPAFPPHNTTNFANTWCPGGVTTAVATFPFLTISIGSTSVSLPSSIGRNSSYPGGVACDLPVLTRPPVTGYPAGTVYVESPWAFDYNLSTFFSIWSLSYANVFVNASHASQPIVYSANDLLGFSSDSTHGVHQFVDGSPSTAGPALGIVTLDYGPHPYPSCLGEKYGTGHRILLTYGAPSAGAAGSPLRSPILATGPADPGANSLLYDSPMPHLGFGARERSDLAQLSSASLGWLLGRLAA